METHFRQARASGLRCIAITDHHHFDSLPSVLETATRYPEVRAIPAAELSVTTSLGAIDLLCYGLPPEIDRSPWQREAGAAISKGMVRLGFPYPDEARLALLRTYRPETAIARQGVTPVNNNVQRRFFLEQGFIRRDEDYPALIAELEKTVTVPPYPPVEEVVEAVHAHNYFGGADSKRMERLRDECALDGVECAHPAVAPELTTVYREFCRNHDLLSLAGSDAHTAEDVGRWMGRHGGDPSWVDEFLGRLDG